MYHNFWSTLLSLKLASWCRSDQRVCLERTDRRLLVAVFVGTLCIVMTRRGDATGMDRRTDAYELQRPSAPGVVVLLCGMDVGHV